jgi:hypothetical protein
VLLRTAGAAAEAAGFGASGVEQAALTIAAAASARIGSARRWNMGVLSVMWTWWAK